MDGGWCACFCWRSGIIVSRTAVFLISSILPYVGTLIFVVSVWLCGLVTEVRWGFVFVLRPFLQMLRTRRLIVSVLYIPHDARMCSRNLQLLAAFFGLISDTKNSYALKFLLVPLII
jgi:hypothetical protein